MPSDQTTARMYRLRRYWVWNLEDFLVWTGREYVEPVCFPQPEWLAPGTTKGTDPTDAAEEWLKEREWDSGEDDEDPHWVLVVDQETGHPCEIIVQAQVVRQHHARIVVSDALPELPF